MGRNSLWSHRCSGEKMTYQIWFKTTTEAAKDLEPDSGILIFASHKRYGGGYLNHSRAQEEAVFNTSSLPNKTPPLGFYPVGDHEARGFMVRAEIDKKPFTFIFVPAPLWTRNPSEIMLRKRAKVIFNLAVLSGVKTLLLGAWGCGVFKCPAKLVAKVLLEEANDFPGKVIFAVPNPNEEFVKELQRQDQ